MRPAAPWSTTILTAATYTDTPSSISILTTAPYEGLLTRDAPSKKKRIFFGKERVVVRVSNQRVNLRELFVVVVCSLLSEVLSLWT